MSAATFLDPQTTPPRDGRAGNLLAIMPVTFRQACDFIAEHHRHHRPPQGMKFALGVGVGVGNALCGVTTVGRPIARNLDDGRTLEVTRTCTDGTPNANSMLLGAAWRVTRDLGYHRLVTYTQHGESGASLRAAGFQRVAINDPNAGWDRPHRRRTRADIPVARSRWEICRREKSGTPTGKPLARASTNPPLQSLGRTITVA